jgi:hypothetical protein
MNRSVGRIVESRSMPSGVGFTIQLEDGTNRKLGLALAIKSSLPNCRRLAQRTLSELVGACQLEQITDTTQLHNILIVVRFYPDCFVDGFEAIVKPREAIAIRRLYRPRKWWQFWRFG